MLLSMHLSITVLLHRRTTGTEIQTQHTDCVLLDISLSESNLLNGGVYNASYHYKSGF